MRWRCPECGRDGGDQPDTTTQVVCFNTLHHKRNKPTAMQPEDTDE